MKNRILALVATTMIFTANPASAMDGPDESILSFPLPKMSPIETDFGSEDPQLVREYKRLLKEYHNNPKGVSTSILSPSLKCLPRLLWELEKELHKDDPKASRFLRDANSSGRLDLDTVESFCYLSEVLSDNKGKICIGSKWLMVAF